MKAVSIARTTNRNNVGGKLADAVESMFVEEFCCDDLVAAEYIVKVSLRKF